MIDFSLSPEIEDVRQRTSAFVAEYIVPLEASPKSYDEHENISLELLETVGDPARQWHLETIAGGLRATANRSRHR